MRVRRYLETAEKIWTYEGTPHIHYPHALLTRGFHSNGFVDVGTLLRDFPQTRNNIAGFIFERLSHVWNKTITRVVGAATSSTLLAKAIADIGQIDHITMIKTHDEKQVWDFKNKPLTDGERILHIEDLITTGESSLRVRKGIREEYPGLKIEFIPFLPVVVDRSDPENRVTTIEESQVLPLLKLDIKTFKPEDCPYCKVGSQALRPREGNNWEKLTRKT